MRRIIQAAARKADALAEIIEHDRPAGLLRPCGCQSDPWVFGHVVCGGIISGEKFYLIPPSRGTITRV